MTSDEPNFREPRSENGHESKGLYGDRPRGNRSYRSRDDRRSGERDSGRSFSNRGYRSRDGRRSEGGNREGGECRHHERSYGDRSGSQGRSRDRGYRQRDDRRSDGRRQEREDERPKLSIPSDVTAILHKGVDCEINGRTDLAQILYLHGASKLNGGSENNLLRMLREAGKDQFSTIRGRLNKECSAEIMPVFDYLCHTIDSNYDISNIQEAAGAGNILAIHCLIRLGLIEKDDVLIDAYAKQIRSNPDIVTKGLQILSRKTDSAKARKYLDDYNEYLKVRNTITPIFSRAMKGEGSARKDLNRLAGLYPEAKFLEGYYMAVEAGNGEEYLKSCSSECMPYILTNLQNLRLADSPYAKYLVAKKLQSKGGQWIPAMVAAVKEGSDEAMDELSEIQNRKEIRKSLESFYLAKNDVESLVMAYDGRNSEYLDKYCNGEPDKILKVGKLLGGSKEIEWLSRSIRNGCSESRVALVAIASDERRYGKPLIYALHDCGEDIEAARVYFEMLGDPSLPSVKWLAKVCRNEEAKEYVRLRFEEMGEMETFESIFIDDGYVPKYKMKSSRPQGRRRY